MFVASRVCLLLPSHLSIWFCSGPVCLATPLCCSFLLCRFALALVMARRRQRYSDDLKMRVVYQRRFLGYETEKIAHELKIPLRVCQRVLDTYKKTGFVSSIKMRKGRPRAMNKPMLEVLLDITPYVSHGLITSYSSSQRPSSTFLTFIWTRFKVWCSTCLTSKYP